MRSPNSPPVPADSPAANQTSWRVDANPACPQHALSSEASAANLTTCSRSRGGAEDGHYDSPCSQGSASLPIQGHPSLLFMPPSHHTTTAPHPAHPSLPHAHCPMHNAAMAHTMMSESTLATAPPVPYDPMMLFNSQQHTHPRITPHVGAIAAFVQPQPQPQPQSSAQGGLQTYPWLPMQAPNPSPHALVPQHHPCPPSSNPTTGLAPQQHVPFMAGACLAQPHWQAPTSRGPPQQIAAAMLPVLGAPGGSIGGSTHRGSLDSSAMQGNPVEPGVAVGGQNQGSGDTHGNDHAAAWRRKRRYGCLFNSCTRLIPWHSTE